MYVAAANRIGREGSKEYYGLSAVYGPDGSILDALDDQPGWAIADVDAALVRQRRHVLPYFRDRRPELYGGLTDTSTGG
jgi:N-carbamoylputrescine amidase